MKGSPLAVWGVEPHFSWYLFVERDPGKVKHLQRWCRQYPDRSTQVIQGDCNGVLEVVIPLRVAWHKYKRAFCLLDPYGPHLDWRVVKRAGEFKAIDLLLNFSVMDMNRNVLWTQPHKVGQEQADRMTHFWGDETWRDEAYAKKETLFGEQEEKLSNEEVAKAFCNRLKEKAGFEYVCDPLPMRNSRNAVVYYLVFASQKRSAAKIVKDIFQKYRLE